MNKIYTKIYQCRRLGPRPYDALEGEPVCPGCRQVFKMGDYTTLVVIGPGLNEEAQRACREGEPFNAICVEAHWSCVTGEVDA